jgi:hypothetical protein
VPSASCPSNPSPNSVRPAVTPVGGLTPAQQLAFRDGSLTFSNRYTIADGLGLVFNDDSCSDCHQNGGSNRRVSRFGRVDPIGAFDSTRSIRRARRRPGVAAVGVSQIALESRIRDAPLDRVRADIQVLGQLAFQARRDFFHPTGKSYCRVALRASGTLLGPSRCASKNDSVDNEARPFDPHSLEEHVQALGGSLAVHRSTGTTAVVISIPL